MKADEALKISMESLPNIEDKEYNKIMERITRIAEKGETSLITFNLPSEAVCKRLQDDGFRFYKTNTPFGLMEFFSIRWNVEKPEIKWYQKLLNLINGN